MSKKRALVWGAVGGCIFGSAMLLIGEFCDSHPPGYHGHVMELLTAFFWLAHRPLLALFRHLSNFFYAAAAIIGYWSIIGVTAGLLIWLFNDCRVRGVRRHAALLICSGWVLGTFALHCWVLHALAGMPSGAFAKLSSEEQTMALNSLLTGYVGTLEDRARARAVMQTQMPGRQMPGSPAVVPSVEEKLAIALRFEENAQGLLKSVAAITESAERRTARRAWISWATTAFTPVILFAFFATTRSRLASGRQPNASPNGGAAMPPGASGAAEGPPLVS